MSLRKIVFVGAFALHAVFAASAQQITRFGVVDTAKVYQAYFKNSAPMRNYETKKAEFQAEIDKKTDEIQRLKQRKLDALAAGSSSQASRLDSEITKKTNALTEYTRAKNQELDSIKNSLQNSDAFYKKLYSVIERVAENEGFTMILSLQQGNGILWYSQSVDVTDKVISQLGM